jgi:hypothetical protein
MECLKQYPWITAAIIAALLSLFLGLVIQCKLISEDRRSIQGYFLGMFEAIIFLAAFAGAGVMGAAWLGFKVASKWKSWALLPEKEDRAELTKQYRSFLLGTAGNLVIGLAAFAIGTALGGKPLS